MIGYTENYTYKQIVYSTTNDHHVSHNNYLHSTLRSVNALGSVNARLTFVIISNYTNIKKSIKLIKTIRTNLVQSILNLKLVQL